MESMEPAMMRRTSYTEDFNMKWFQGASARKNVSKSILFLAIAAVMFWQLNVMLMPKYIYKNGMWPTTSSYNQFYDMKRDSIDVIFLGSSVVVNAFSPQEIYDAYRIRSYNLGSEQQSVFLSYYWLKEALRYQHPKVVVLDSTFIFSQHPGYPINTTEGLTRKCLDPMRWSTVKYEAVKALCDLDEKQTVRSYYLLTDRFHDRWKDLQEMDFVPSEVSSAPLKGFYAKEKYGEDEYVPFESKDESTLADADSVNYEYCGKMAKLCEENGIILLLVTLPKEGMSDGENNTLMKLADENGIDYINFCKKENYEKLNVQLPRENTVLHASVWGACKMSRFVGSLLQEKYGVSGVQDEQWEETRSFYEMTKNSCELPHVTDLHKYLSLVSDDRYTVFITIAIKGKSKSVIDDTVIASLRELGFDADHSFSNDEAYCMVHSAEGMLEEPADETDKTGGIRGHHSIYKINCSATNPNKKSLIEIDGINYAKNSYGMNIVVYDNEFMKVVDSVCFASNDPAAGVKR